MRGYDNPRFHQVTVLDLQFCEGTGTTTQDWSKGRHFPVTLVNAPTWTNATNDLTYLNFDGAAPYDHIIISAAASTALNFTSGDFSGAVWFYPGSAGNRMVFNKGTGTTGWDFSNYGGAGVAMMRFATYQAGPTNQYSDGPDLALNTWHFVGFTRSGADVRIYEAGRDATAVYGTHVNPASAAASNFYIGCADAVGAGWLIGNLWRPRIWSRQLTAAEMLAIYETERDLFGV